MSTETPNTVHGRLLEAVHISGYSFERACSELKWLLAEDRWTELGFEDGSAFARSIKAAFSEFRVSIDERGELVKGLARIASQRAISDALGIGRGTVQRALNGGPDGPENTDEDEDISIAQEMSGPDGPVETNPSVNSGHHLSRNTGENEWYTPSEFIAAAREVLGAIDLDPASNDLAQETVRAERYFTKDDDGLAHDWRGRVWMNPPYSQPLISQFISKLNAEFSSGCVTAAIMLTNNSTDTAWFHNAIGLASAVCFTQGRIKFWSGRTGEQVPAPLQGHAFFYFGDDHEAFAKRFTSIGFVVRPA